MTVNWFNSINASGSDANAYSSVIQSVISSACPTGYCALDFAAARVVRISWQNLFYELPYVNQSIVSLILFFLLIMCKTLISLFYCVEYIIFSIFNQYI